MKIDLHIHSSASDGSFTPGEIIDFVQELELGAFSITDHDTVDGNRDAALFGMAGSVEFITGVEISSYPPEPFVSSGSFHILGYGFDVDDPVLNKSLKKFQRAREERNPKIISKLNNAGIEITMDEVIVESGGGLVGRPHIASLLKKKGHVDSIKSAFNKYLATDQIAYVEKFRIDCENAIRLIRNAGGVPVLAHPVTIGMDYDELEELLKVLIIHGLMGIEAYYTNHSPERTKQYCRIADKLGLLTTGGSDFHGSLKDDVEIGTGKGDLDISYNLFEKLKKAVA